jgi:hypothetical protein
MLTVGDADRHIQKRQRNNISEDRTRIIVGDNGEPIGTIDS